MQNADHLVWMDLEMTGLDPDRDVIIEMATLITDSNLNIVAEGPVIAIHQPDVLLDAMDEWCTRTHGESGLIERVKNSTVSLKQAQQQTLEFIKQWLPANTSPLCGNSIHQDRRFLVRYMPELESYLHYRNLDVSTLKELARRWNPQLLDNVKKQGSHLALDDIKDSINELLYYKHHFINAV